MLISICWRMALHYSRARPSGRRNEDYINQTGGNTERSRDRKGYSFLTAIAIVVSNMIGTGLFTTMGFQASATPSTGVIVLLWIAGGVQALCGAIVYRVLSKNIPEAGGESAYLGTLIGPSTGFVAAWISAIIGFSAPIALAAVAWAGYVSRIIPVPVHAAAVVVIMLMSFIHVNGTAWSGLSQRLTSAMKGAVIILFIAVGFWMIAAGKGTVLEWSFDPALAVSSSFAVSFVYVSFAYSGWNAAVYLPDALEDPDSTVGRSLMLGTLIVTAVSVCVNVIFLYLVPLEEAAGVVEIGHLAAERMFGTFGGKLMSGALSVVLLSSIGAMTIAGSRLYAVFGKRYSFLSGVLNEKDPLRPRRAVFLQMAVALAMVLTASFEQVLTMAGSTLALSTFITVAAMVVHRKRLTRTLDRSALYVVLGSAALFLLMNGWILIYLAIERPMAALVSLCFCLAGYAIYFAVRWRTDRTVLKDHSSGKTI
jgi:APA family basic amino acid/polyamine antiporter